MKTNLFVRNHTTQTAIAMFVILCLGLIIIQAAALRIPSPKHAFSNLRAGSSKLNASINDKAPKSEFGWDSHQAVKSIPESLVNEIDGNESMRAKFEHLCRTSQVITL